MKTSYLAVGAGDKSGINFETYRPEEMFGDQVLGHPCLEEIANNIAEEINLEIDIMLFKKLPIETLKQIISLAEKAIEERG